MNPNITIHPLKKSDKDWAENLWIKMWNADHVVSRGIIHYLSDLKGFVAESNSESVGLLTYRVENGHLEIVTLDSLMEGVGIGTALIDEVIEEAKKRKCNRVWLVTTNDNTEALRFYQRRGFIIHAFHRSAIEESRKLKPNIPHVGEHGIPIRDEIELEYLVD